MNQRSMTKVPNKIMIVGLILLVVFIATILCIVNFNLWERATNLAIIVGSVAAIIVFLVYLENIRWNFYRYLAEVYYEILKKGMEYPELVDLDNTKNYKNVWPLSNPVNRKTYYRYNAYAQMCWAFAEDIYDTQNHIIHIICKKFFSVDFIKLYYPTFKRIKKLHGAWLQDNREEFTLNGFLEFIDGLDKK